MMLEPGGETFTEVLDGLAFTMRYGANRVVVMVPWETLVRLGLPDAGRAEFLAAQLPRLQAVADAKFALGQHENRGSRIRIQPRDLAAADQRKAVAA